MHDVSLVVRSVVIVLSAGIDVMIKAMIAQRKGSSTCAAREMVNIGCVELRWSHKAS